ncbi:MAG: lipase family protein [Opitutaceae bacterium]
MARKYPYNTSADALLKPARNAVFFEAWDADVDTLNHDLLCAEMSRLAYAEEAVVTTSLAKAGFSPVGFFGGESLRTRLATRGTEGFVANNSKHGITVLAFRGTESGKFEDIFSDLGTVQMNFPGGGRVHTGFHQAYETVRDRIATLLAQGEESLLIAGHSLGAALATIAATDFLPESLITFGSPRVGDGRFCERLVARVGGAAIHRFVDCCDVVVRVPPERFERGHFLALFEELGNFEQSNPLGGRAVLRGR